MKTKWSATWRDLFSFLAIRRWFWEDQMFPKAPWDTAPQSQKVAGRFPLVEVTLWHLLVTKSPGSEAKLAVWAGRCLSWDWSSLFLNVLSVMSFRYLSWTSQSQSRTAACDSCPKNEWPSSVLDSAPCHHQCQPRPEGKEKENCWASTLSEGLCDTAC